MPRNCNNLRDNFCYVCGKYILKRQKRPITERLKAAYLNYFGIILGDQDKPWAPHVVCTTCYTILLKWFNGEEKHMAFGVPMVWREPSNHHDDCYFCLFNQFGINSTKEKRHTYPNIPSAMQPIQHSESVPIPKCCTSNTDNSIGDVSDQDFDFIESKSNTPKLICQSMLDDLVRDLGLTKDKSELLGSRLKEWNLLSAGTKISVYRNRDDGYRDLFKTEGFVSYCHDIAGLINVMGVEYDPKEWRLFIDGSKSSLKAVLLSKYNVYASIPVAYAIDVKETYESLKLILNLVKYEQHQWAFSGDFKVIAIVMGLQLGFTKFPCFLCLFNSRARSLHYSKKTWPARSEFVIGSNNIKYSPLIEPRHILLPPLHIKLGLMKQYVKALNKEGETFKYLLQIFPKISEAKIKEGIFIGPQIRELMRDQCFMSIMDTNERLAWESFKDVIERFLGNHKAPDFEAIVERMIVNFKNMGCLMNLKIHCLNSHLDYFPTNLGAESEELGEKFHQDLKVMEERYKGVCGSAMMADYCWSLAREDPMKVYRRKARKRQFFSP